MARLVHNLQKKQHKERSQNRDRARYGLLEKKKDYKVRAADYHKKQAALKALKQKAQLYNPDEYYHAMTSRKTDERGVLIAERAKEVLTPDQLKLFKTQDINYIRTQRLNEMHKIKKLQKELDFKATGQHTVFVDSLEEQERLTPQEFFNTDTSLLDRRENRLRISQLETNFSLVNQPSSVEHHDIDKLQEEKRKKYTHLQERIQREAELRKVEEQMDLSRELTKRGDKKMIYSIDGKMLYKWKNERKR